MNAVVERAQTAVAVPEQTPMTMLALAVQQGADIDKLTKLMDLQERWEKNEAMKAYNEAFAAFKSEAVPVLKNKLVTDGPLKGKSYAELFSVVDAVTPMLSKHGLSHSWKLTKDERDWIEVTCLLKHVRGGSDCATMGGPPDVGGAKSAIQARASTISYLERYTLKAVCGVAEKGDDTDGNGGGKKGPEPDAEGKKKLEACGSEESLKKAWAALTEEQRKSLTEVMKECKKRVREADGA